MPDTSIKNDWWEHHVFHEKLESQISNNYSVEPLWSKVIAWGYSTVAIYLEDKHKQKYIVKLSKKADKEIKVLEKDINLSHYLNEHLPTSKYLMNTSGKYITEFQDYNLRIQKHIEGVVPLKMTYDVYEQLLKLIHKLHQVQPPLFEVPSFELNSSVTTDENFVLLHGDPTPQNILVSYQKITALLDFEWAMTGPKEWDISKALLFSWFNLEEGSLDFDDVLHFTIKNYKNEFDKALVYDFSKLHLENTLNNINDRISEKGQIESLVNYAEFLEDRENLF